MDVFNVSNGFVGREVVFRSIQFERYRKPCVTSYPRHSVVLNPHHTREFTRRMGTDYEHDDSSSSSASEVSGEEDTDDDDPLNLEDEMMLCRNEQLRQLLHLRWRHIGPSGCGLQNMGNTCFANSVLQAIAYTPALAQYFANVFKSPCSHVVGASYDYAYALGETVRKIHAISNGIYRPGLIVSNLKALSPHFRLGRQGDAHEFMLHLMNACHRSSLFRSIGSRKVTHRIEQTNALQRIIGGYLCSVVAWSKQEEIDRLTKVGKVQEATDLQISSRGHSGGVLVSNTYDPFVTLSVEVVGQTLDHCLAKLCEEEKLDGRSYISPRGVGVRAKKHFQLHKLPPVLIIHLKRFNCNGGKVSKFVQYPKILDVTPYCTVKGITKATGCRDVNGGDGRRLCLYELNAICIHEGNSIDYGHYYSIVRARNGTWLLCNDERVSHCDERYALRQQAYMLVYSLVESTSLRNTTTAKTDTCTSQLSTGPNTTTKTMLVSSSSSSAAVVVPRHVKERKDKEEEEEEEEELGRQLGDEEIERILKKKKAAQQRKLDPMNTTESLKYDRSNGRGDVHADNNNKNNNDYQPPENGNGDEDDALPSFYTTVKAEVTRTENGHSKSSHYGGIIKALRRITPPVKEVNTPNVNVEKKEIVGTQAVAAVEEMTQKNIPRTVVRPKHAPKFRQCVRDPLWESEMDRGRIKRVRVKRDEYIGENKFQKANIEFDSRGRRRHRSER